MSRNQRRRNHRRQQKAAQTQAAALPQVPPQSGEGDYVESRKDAEIVKSAVKQRWPIPDEIRPAIINQLSKLATDPVEDGRTQIAASQVIVQMDRLNLEDEKRQDDAPGTQVNVNVGVQIAALDSLSDSELLQYIDEAKRSLASSTPGEPGADTAAMVPELPATETA